MAWRWCGGEAGVFVHVHVSVFSWKYCKQRYWFLQFTVVVASLRFDLHQYCHVNAKFVRYSTNTHGFHNVKNKKDEL